MKKKLLTVLVAIIAALAVACFAAAVAEKSADIANNTATSTDATPTDVTPDATPTDVTPDATPTDVTPDATPTDVTPDATPTDVTPDATPTDATATDATATDARRLGDVDGDGKIKPEDARLALRASVHLEKYAEDSDEFFAADINANGVIEPEDARKILLASVNLFNLNDPLATPTDAQPEEEEEPVATPTDATPMDAQPEEEEEPVATPTDVTPTDTMPADAADSKALIDIAAKVYLLCEQIPGFQKTNYMFAKGDSVYFSELVKLDDEGSGDAFCVAFLSDSKQAGCYNIANDGGYICVKIGVPESESGQTLFDLDQVKARAEEIGAIKWNFEKAGN